MHVRKTEIVYWIEQGWLEAVRRDQGRSTCYTRAFDHLFPRKPTLGEIHETSSQFGTVLLIGHSPGCGCVPVKRSDNESCRHQQRDHVRRKSCAATAPQRSMQTSIGELVRLGKKLWWYSSKMAIKSAHDTARKAARR